MSVFLAFWNTSLKHKSSRLWKYVTVGKFADFISNSYDCGKEIYQHFCYTWPAISIMNLMNSNLSTNDRKMQFSVWKSQRYCTGKPKIAVVNKQTFLK